MSEGPPKREGTMYHGKRMIPAVNLAYAEAVEADLAVALKEIERLRDLARELYEALWNEYRHGARPVDEPLVGGLLTRLQSKYGGSK